MDGEPLPNAFVVYAPLSGGTTSYGKTDESGQYEMVFNEDEKGAWIGMNRVEISTGDVASGDVGGAREVVPVVCNRETTLTADVKPGTNQFDFPLEWSAGRIAPAPQE
jgi:hypothetical protein